MDNACHHVRACRGGRTLLAQSRLAALWLAAEAKRSITWVRAPPARRDIMTRQRDMLTLHVSGHIPHKHRRRAVDHLNGRSSSTGVTLALPRSSGANAAAHERQAARLTHTSASTARTTWRCRTCGKWRLCWVLPTWMPWHAKARRACSRRVRPHRRRSSNRKAGSRMLENWGHAAERVCRHDQASCVDARAACWAPPAPRAPAGRRPG